MDFFELTGYWLVVLLCATAVLCLCLWLEVLFRIRRARREAQQMRRAAARWSATLGQRWGR